MLFNSFAFALFFVVVYAAYLACMRRRRTQNALLLVASYFFYGCWDWRFLGLILASTLIDYACGRALDRRRSDGSGPIEDAAPYAHSARARRAILLVSVGANLGILGFFKYFDFFVESGAELLQMIGLPLTPRLLAIVLPVGISFYTFQTLSYTIDIYRGQLRAERSLLDLALFVAFFPQLVAGPILRAKDFLPQIARRRQLVLEQVYTGGYLILWGLFKKVVLADNLAVVVDRTFSSDGSPSGATVIIAVYAFALQIYCDFSGYTDIARGSTKMMGFEIPLNFNLPYFSATPAEFWRRWHISLSGWLRDYLYIPLGGDRRGRRRTAINLLITMLLGGLWHGAAWTFVLWGLFHALLIIAYRGCVPAVCEFARTWSERTRMVGRWVAVAGFFQLTCLGYLIFRAESVAQIGTMLHAVLSPGTLRGTGVTVLVACAVPLLAVQFLQHLRGDLNALLSWPAPVRGLVYVGLFFGLVIFGEPVAKPFIYFQF